LDWLRAASVSLPPSMPSAERSMPAFSRNNAASPGPRAFSISLEWAMMISVCFARSPLAARSEATKSSLPSLTISS
jgi:hypothetical protein